MTALTNPILPPHSADPWMIRHGSRYLYCESRNGLRSIGVRASKDIHAIGEDPGVIVWNAPASGPGSNSIWAPELHFLNGHWFIYYAADDGKNENHRMWVLESENADPYGPYHCRGQLSTDGWAIDGTPLEINGQLYFIWSGWPEKRDGLQNLYIAPMAHPTAISAERTLLCSPDHAWERVGMPICEAPQILKANGSVFLIYSASGSWTPDYCLGMMIHRHGDALNPATWHKRGPVFQKTDHVWGIGHCCFVKSPCQTQDWLLYHSKSRKAPGWEDRDVHAKPFSWTSEGLPDFGTPPPRRPAGARSASPKPLPAAVPLHAPLPLVLPTPTQPCALNG